jgi:hypothetical protein
MIAGMLGRQLPKVEVMLRDAAERNAWTRGRPRRRLALR